MATGISENGYYLWGLINRPALSKPIIESDRVEGTAVFDREGHQIGTIQRLLIEKVSGRVLYVDVTFGGFLGIGVHHHTIPWEKLAYDGELEGHRTDITESQVRGAPTFAQHQRPGSVSGEPVIDLSTAAAEAVGLSRVGKITLAKL